MSSPTVCVPHGGGRALHAVLPSAEAQKPVGQAVWPRRPGQTSLSVVSDSAHAPFHHQMGGRGGWLVHVLRPELRVEQKQCLPGRTFVAR